MRREQGYNIFKIQAGIPFFDTTFVHNTKKYWPQLHLIFFKFDLFLIKTGFQKILERNNFVEKKILCHLRRSAPETLKR